MAKKPTTATLKTKKELTQYFFRYGTIGFFVVAGICVSVGVLFILQLLNVQADTPSVPKTIIFDKKTIDDVNKLRDRSQTYSDNLEFPKSRTDPFREDLEEQ